MAYQATQVTDTWDTLFTSAARKIRPRVYRQTVRKMPLLYWLEEKGRKRTEDGGQEIVVPLEYGDNTTTMPYGRFDTLNTTPTEGVTAAIYKWANVATSITLAGEDLRKNAGVAQRFSLLDSEMKRAENSMRKKLAATLHGLHGSLGLTFVGRETANAIDSQGGTAVDSPVNMGDFAYKWFNSLDNIVRSGWGLMNNDATTIQSHTVGGITVSVTLGTGESAYNLWDDIVANTGSWVNAWWMNYANPGVDLLQETSVGGTIGNALPESELIAAEDLNAASPAGMLTAMREMFNRLEQVDIILTARDVYGQYEGLLVPNERYYDMKLGDAGFQNLRYRTVPLVMDKGITTVLRGTPTGPTTKMSPMYFLNSDSFEWVVHRDADFVITPFRTPTNQDAKTAQILFMGNLCCNNRSQNGVISFGDGAAYHT